MPSIKTLCISVATAGCLFAGLAFAQGDVIILKAGDDWEAFKKFTEKKVPPCITCHQLDKKLVGPSYQEVAEKRKEEAAKDKQGTIDMLAEKIIKGNAGSAPVYGGAVMTPNTMVTEEEAKKIAEWVLALAEEKETAKEEKEAAKEEKEAAQEEKKEGKEK